MVPLLGACGETATPKDNLPTEAPVAVSDVYAGNQQCLALLGTVKDFGHGVLFFGYNRRDFPQALTRYLDSHPTLEVTTLTNDGPGDSLQGFIVIVRERK